MRSACRTLENRWEITSTVRPASRSPMRSNRSCSARGSSAAVGSSRMTKGASREKARPRATRCRCPMDRSVPPTILARGRSRTPARVRRGTRRRRRGRPRPGSPGGRRPLLPSEPDVVPRAQVKADEVLKITATERRSPSASMSRTSAPSHRIVPVCGSYRPASSLASVVLPDPFSPTSATTSPA